MPKEADRTKQAFALLEEPFLHPKGPQNAVRAAARLVLAGTVPIPHVELQVQLVQSAAALNISHETVVADAIGILRGDETAKNTIVVYPCAANDTGHAVPFGSLCGND